MDSAEWFSLGVPHIAVIKWQQRLVSPEAFFTHISGPWAGWESLPVVSSHGYLVLPHSMVVLGLLSWTFFFYMEVVFSQGDQVAFSSKIIKWELQAFLWLGLRSHSAQIQHLKESYTSPDSKGERKRLYSLWERVGCVYREQRIWWKPSWRRATTNFNDTCDRHWWQCSLKHGPCPKEMQRWPQAQKGIGW